jgi:AcrR family transcriptional regulator
MTPPPAATVDRSQATRDRILAGAREVFFARGYAGASMAEIGKAAAVSKGTLYVHFPDKDALFAAVLASECETIRARHFVFDHDAPLAPTLRFLGIGFLRAILARDAMGLYRALVGEAHRQPALGEVFMRAGPRPGARALAALLRAADQRGELRIADAELAAHQFIHLCDAGLSQRAHMGEGLPSDDEVARHVDAAVSLFLRGYAPLA